MFEVVRVRKTVFVGGFFGCDFVRESVFGVEKFGFEFVFPILLMLLQEMRFFSMCWLKVWGSVLGTRGVAFRFGSGPGQESGARPGTSGGTSIVNGFGCVGLRPQVSRTSGEKRIGPSLIKSASLTMIFGVFG